VLRVPLRDPASALEQARLPATWGVFARYGLPLIAATTAYQLLSFANRGAVAAQAGFTEAGYFALAADVSSRSLTTFGTALDILLFQIAVHAEEHRGRAAAEAQVALNAATVFALLAPCAVGFWAVLPALQDLVVPEAYRGPFETYSLALIPGLFCLAMMSYAVNPAFQIRRRTLPVIAAALVGFGLNGIGLLALPPVLGGIGVAWAQTLGLAGACLWLGWRVMTGPEPLALPWGQIGAAALACAAMGLALAPFRTLPAATALAVLLPLGVAVYGALVWLFDIAGLRGQVMARFRPERAVA
jgi:hypothetical protein